MKLTLAPRAAGYTGQGLHDVLRAHGVECEFADPDYLTLMPSASTPEETWTRLEKVLYGVPVLPALPEEAPPLPVGERVCSLREALLSPHEMLPVEDATGRVLADPCVSCPPAVPIHMAGERIDEAAIRCFRYYGVSQVRVRRRGIHETEGKWSGQT